MSTPSKKPRSLATAADIVRLLGDIGDNGIVEVLALTPTLLEIEEAAAWLDAEEPPKSGRENTQTSRIAQIVEIADRDDEEPEYRR